VNDLFNLSKAGRVRERFDGYRKFTHCRFLSRVCIRKFATRDIDIAILSALLSVTRYVLYADGYVKMSSKFVERSIS